MGWREEVGDVLEEGTFWWTLKFLNLITFILLLFVVSLFN